MSHMCSLLKIDSVPGLYVYENFISLEMESLLLSQIDFEFWEGDYKRRVQYHSFDYDFKRGTSHPVQRQISGYLAHATQHINHYVLQDNGLIINGMFVSPWNVSL